MRVTGRPAAYGLAALIGVAAAAWTLPWAAMAGTGGLFQYPAGDLSQNLTGHLAFQDPGWHWPPLRAPALAWPGGQSIAMTDSNPVLSLLAKLAACVTGHRGNWMGVWFALCIALQPVAAVYAMRGFRRAPQDSPGDAIGAGAAAFLSLMLPAYLYRVIHINLFGHFLLLAALGYSVRLCVRQRGPRFWPSLGLLLVTVFVHPYLFVFSAITMAAPALQLLVGRQPGAREGLRIWALAVLIAIGAFLGLSESLSVGGPGFGLYSMNLLGPFWPQVSGLFGPGLPILDATGFQREGFNYLGAGNVLLLTAGAVALMRAGRLARRTIAARFAGLGVCLIGLAAIAVTPRLTFGHAVLLPVDVPLLDRLLASIRASGRAIWVVDYAVLLGSVAFLSARLQPRVLLPLMLCVVALQWLDTAPLRLTARAYFVGQGQAAPGFTLPRGTTLFSVVPLCAADEFRADADRLYALRAGARLKEVRLAHPALPVACEEALRAGTETPLAPGETRLFVGRLDVQRTRLGGVCGDSAAGLVCSR